MLSSLEGNMHHLNEGPFVLDAESSFVLSTSPTFHLSPWEIRPGPEKIGLTLYTELLKMALTFRAFFVLMF
jgi:hypothetical protein